MSFSIEDLQAVIGRQFPGGPYTIEPWRAWLTQDAMVAPTGGEFAHPAFVFMAATGAMGMSWDDLFAWFGAVAADGPMFGDCKMAIEQPLRVGATYRVSGQIVSAERKTGKQLGQFDLVGYVLELHDEANNFVASIRNSIVFPRKA